MTEDVPRGEFLQRMAGTGAAEQLQEAGRNVRVIALMDAEALYRWITTRSAQRN